jgi:hypothetical protein
MKSEKVKQYFKKLGIAGFLFFLIKGLVWLFIFLGGAKLFWGN